MSDSVIIFTVVLAVGGWLFLFFARRKTMRTPETTATPELVRDKPVLITTKIDTVKTDDGMPVRYRLYLVFTTGELFIAANSDKEPLEAIETDIRKELGL